MSSNDITGDRMTSKPMSAEAKKRFDENFDRIFKNRTHTATLPKVPKGYTVEELERDNPYNQWIDEQYKSDLLNKDDKLDLEQEWPL